MRGKRGQAGIEYVLLTGLLLFFFIPLIHYSLQETNNALKISQVDSYVGRLSKAVDAVHAIGPGATEIVSVTVPKGVVEANLVNQGSAHEIVLRVQFQGGLSDVHASVKPYLIEVDEGGELPKSPGTYHIKVRSLNLTAVNVSLT